MNNIIKHLEELGIAQASLPKTLLNKIDHLEDLRATLQDTRKEYAEEQNPEVRQSMREVIAQAEEAINDLETSLDSDVKAFKLDLQNQADENEDTAKQTASRSSDADGVVAKASEPSKGGNAFKWILGGVVLLITLGAVNTLNKE